MENNLVKKLQRGLAVVSFGLATLVSSACGDTYEGDNVYNYPSSGSGEEIAMYDCDDVTGIIVDCGVYKGSHNPSITPEEGYKMTFNKCQKDNWETVVPAFMNCVGESSCDDLVGCNDYFTIEW